MSKWMICNIRNKECGKCLHARKHLHESDCDYLTICKNKTLLGYSVGKCETTTPPEKKNK